MSPIFNTRATVEMLDGCAVLRRTYTVFGIAILSTVERL